MFSSISILDNDIHYIEMIHHKTERPIRCRICCILPHTKRTENSRNKWRIVSDLVDHRVVRPILHGIKHHFKFDGFGGGWLGDDFDGDKSCIIDVVISVDGTHFGERS